MKTKKAGILTKLVILSLLVILSTALLNVRGQLTAAQGDLNEALLQKADQEQVNADLADAVEHSDDPARQADILREKRGWAEPGERVFKFN